MLPSEVKKVRDLHLPRIKTVPDLSGLFPSDANTQDADLLAPDDDNESKDIRCYTVAELFLLLSRIEANRREHSECMILDIDELMKQISNPVLLKKLSQCIGALTMLRFFSATLTHIFEKLSSIAPTHPEYEKNQQLLKEFRTNFYTTFEQLRADKRSTETTQATVATHLEETLSPFINSSPVTTSVTTFNA